MLRSASGKRSGSGLTLHRRNSLLTLWQDGGREVSVSVRDESRRDKVDWSECPLVESRQGVQSGAPVLRGTRMPVAAIVDNFDYGVSVGEIAEQFELPLESHRRDCGLRPEPSRCASSSIRTFLLVCAVFCAGMRSVRSSRCSGIPSLKTVSYSRLVRPLDLT